MFGLGVITVFLLSVSVSGYTTEEELCRPCEISDVYCIKEDLAAGFLGAVVPVLEQGPNSYDDTYPLNISLSSFDAAILFSEIVYAGFESAIITDYYVLTESNFTVLTAYFDYITINSTYQLNITDPTVPGSLAIVPGTGYSILTDLTAVMAFPGIESLDEVNVVTTLAAKGSFDVSSILNYVNDDLALQFLKKYSLNLDLFFEELIEQIKDRLLHWYFITNVEAIA